MKQNILLIASFLTLVLSGCNSNSQVSNSNIEINISKNDTILRIPFLGDAEPKPLAEFPNMDSAITRINELSKIQKIDFVIGVGDIAHKGTIEQYEAATPIIQKLEVPFYPIMGNEEHNSTVERYIQYAQKWNSNITETQYVLEFDSLVLIFASPDYSREFHDSTAIWIQKEIKRVAPKPVALIVHAAQKGVYHENPEKGVANPIFIKDVTQQKNLAMVISGDLHMDMNRTVHSKKIDHVHYIHIPALERTKIPDETHHTGMFRIMTVLQNGEIIFETFSVNNSNPIQKLTYSFSLKQSNN